MAKRNDDLLTRDTATPDQIRCWDVLATAVGGLHHLPRNVYQCGRGIRVHFTCEFATYDGDMLTRMVLYGHRDCVRVAIGPGGGPRHVCVTAHPRESQMTSLAMRHATLDDLRTRIEIMQTKGAV